MAAHLVPMASTSDMTKMLMRNLINKATDVIGRQNALVNEFTGLNGIQRLQIFRQKAKKNSKLTIKEQLELVDEMVGKNNTKYLEDPRYKEYKSRITTIGNALVDSEGYIDLTEAFGTNIIFSKFTF